MGYCEDFIVSQLYPTWNEIGEIMEVHLYPYGNAHYTQNGDGWSFNCQHGDDECKGNMVATCAQDKLNDINLEMDFIYCMESASWPPNAGATCAAQVGDCQTNLKKVVCDKYTGPKPAACNSYPRTE